MISPFMNDVCACARVLCVQYTPILRMTRSIRHSLTSHSKTNTHTPFNDLYKTTSSLRKHVPLNVICEENSRSSLQRPIQSCHGYKLKTVSIKSSKGALCLIMYVEALCRFIDVSMCVPCVCLRTCI